MYEKNCYLAACLIENFMKRLILLLTLVLAGCEARRSDYVVLASAAVEADSQWLAVAEKLAQRHDARVVGFGVHPREVLPELQKLHPRWVAIVEVPEMIGRDYIIELNRMSREVDDDIYADYLWGVISGYDADSAMRMVDNSAEPLEIKSAVATIMETDSAKWFDRYGYVDDHTAGLWGHKNGPGQSVIKVMIDTTQVLRKFTELYAEYDPDLVLTAAHATEYNLEMPFSLGNWKARDGVLYADDKYTGEKWDVPQSGKRKVYFAMGNCLIGNFDNTRESMAPAWINSANAAAMSGYVVTTWHGRNGWGALKYWLTHAGELTLPEAIYLNQQDMLYQLNAWSPDLVTANFPYDDDFDKQQREAARVVSEATGTKATLDQVGFWHDRDVLAYYGDPKWDVKLQNISDDYSVFFKRKRGKVVLTIETREDFDLKRLQGDGFKQEHVLDLPFVYFFEDRLPSKPRLVSGQDWDAVVTEDFIMIYNPDFEPGKTYTIEFGE